MIEVYSWPTPNGHKVHVMLEECGLAYRAHPVDIGAGDQFKPEFLAISPNNKIPAITDPEGPDGQPISLFESGAILLYLAGKTGRFLPADTRGKYEVLQWLMFQMGGVGPMLGQAHHFRIYAPEKIPYAIERYTNEAKRLYGVMNKRLAQEPVPGRGRLQHRRHRRLSLVAQLEEPGHRLGRSPAPQRLVRRDCRTPRGQARRGGAGRPAQAHHGRPGARDPFWQAAGRAALNPRPRPAS
jgi:glutathione S-transferase